MVESDTVILMIRVLKNSGQMEPFDPKKVERSLRNSGADDRLVDSILSQINQEIYDGIPTRKLYDRIYSLLRKEKKTVGDRYNLRSAIADSSLPFSSFISAILPRIPRAFC